MLIVNVVDTGSNDAAQNIVNLAKAANIPVVFFNRSVDESVVSSYDKCVFVGTDYEMAGHMQGMESDMLKGFELGADDYVTKPFPISVFQKKVSALLNRISAQSGGDFYDDGNLYINFSELSACLAGQPITLTSLEYRLLKVLTRNSQTVLTRQVLLEKLWDVDENYVDEHALTTTISRIRSKIETNQHSYIKTVYGMGYMWIGGAQK